MNQRTGLAIAAVLSAAAPAAAAETAPDLARAMLDAAVKSGAVSDITAVARAAKEVFPDDAAAIDAYAAARIAELAPADAASGGEETPHDSTAAEEEAPKGFFAIKPWEGKVGVSASMSSGNSKNATVGFVLDAKREAGPYVHNVNGYVDFAESQGTQTQQRWGAAYKLDYNLGERTYAFGRVAYDEDAYSGFDYRLFAGAGLGYFLFKDEPLEWKIEAGPGYRYSPIDDSREIDQNFAAYFLSSTDWIIREGIVFEQDFETTWSKPTTTFQSTTSISSTLVESITLGVSFKYRYETGPPAGRENTDTILRANLGYAF